MRVRNLAAAVLVVGLLAAACSSNDSSDGATGSGASGASVTISGFAFDPNALSGSPGQTLQIQVSNKDGVEHSFTLDDGSVSKDIGGGESQTVEVALPESGTVGWHCKYHPSMTGTITVG
jgi:plastocyanin